MAKRRPYARGYTELFDRLREHYGCPTEVLFAIATDHEHDVKHRVNAARVLLRHRYPARLVVQEQDGDDQLDEFTRLLQGLGDKRVTHQELAVLEVDYSHEVDEHDPLLR